MGSASRGTGCGKAFRIILLNATRLLKEPDTINRQASFARRAVFPKKWKHRRAAATRRRKAVCCGCFVAEGGGARKRLAGLSRPVLFRQAVHKRSAPVYHGRFDYRQLRRTIIIRTVFSLRIFRIAMPQSSLIRKKIHHFWPVLNFYCSPNDR